MLERIAQTTHVVSTFWVLVLAAIVLVDVLGRYFFGQPLLGATEVIKNSVVSITFLQLPLAIYRGGMIRSTILYDALGPNWQRGLRSFSNVLGLLLFLGMAFSGWGTQSTHLPGQISSGSDVGDRFLHLSAFNDTGLDRAPWP